MPSQGGPLRPVGVSGMGFSSLDLCGRGIRLHQTAAHNWQTLDPLDQTDDQPDTVCDGVGLLQLLLAGRLLLLAGRLLLLSCSSSSRCSISAVLKPR